MLTTDEQNKDILKRIKNAQQIIRKNFVYIDNPNDSPGRKGGSLIVKINKNPNLVFHFLEFLFDKQYVNLDEKMGYVFVDDKSRWDFLLKSKYGFIRIYDWKGYSVSIGSVGFDPTKIDKNLNKKVTLIKDVIEENVDSFLEFRKIEAKRELEERPLDNFMAAFASLSLLFGYSINKERKENFGQLESLILLVSLVDTMLRYSILLTRINKTKSTRVDPEMIKLFHQEGEKYIKERDIFKIAEKEVDFAGIDKKELFSRLNELYDWRNRAVHRYAITNFQYIEAENIVNKYKDLTPV